MKKFTILTTLLLTVCIVFGQALHTKTKGIPTKTTPVEISNDVETSVFATSLTIDFEDVDDFSLSFDPWSVADVDGLPTYGFTGIEFTHAYEAMAFICFNPESTTPTMADDPEMQPHAGAKFGACFASVPEAGQGNNDWLMTEKIMVNAGSSIDFWAKSYTDEYGMERFNVGVSTASNNPEDFVIISSGDYIEAPMAWTEYGFDLSAYAGQEIYVCLHCVSYDAFVFMVDDIVVTPGEMPSACEGFDEFDDFAIAMDPWTLLDVDGLPTYGFTGIEFEHAYEPMAYLVFNPGATVPAMTDDPEMQPYAGEKFAACFSSVPEAGQGNNDWIISPLTPLGLESELSFMAKSYTDEYGMERFNVGVSTTGMDPEDFTILNGANYLEAPMAWTPYTFDLSVYDNWNVYIAIQCVSYDAFVFMLDEVCINTTPTGISTPSATADLKLYPNPVLDVLNITSNETIEQISIINNLGQVVYSENTKALETKINTEDLVNGIYFVQVKTENGIETKKVIVE
jgi:Secretion system C-terminal sorting domain/Cleaved Adhesin Domain